MKVCITYLFHCSFIVETQNYMLVFDWIKGEIPKSHKKRMAFITHGHADHFNPDIFNHDMDVWIVSNDINWPNSSSIVMVEAQDTLSLAGCEIEVYGSTDLGVSYLVQVDGLRLFFAGDLNNWHWKNESTQSEIKEMNQWYLELIKPLKDKQIDILFIDIDPRLEVEYDLGAKQLLELIHPSIVIPMHFTSNIVAFNEYIKTTQIPQLLPITKENTKIELILEKENDKYTND